MVANSRLGKGLGIPITVVETVLLIVVFLTCSSCFLFQTNEKGQVVTKTALLKQMEELIEEPGLTCCICREGYKFQVKCNMFAKQSHHLRGLSIQGSVHWLWEVRKSQVWFLESKGGWDVEACFQ